MKSVILVFHNKGLVDRYNKTIETILDVCLENFTNVYVLNNGKYTLQRNFIESNRNSNEDSFGIYSIKYIYNNIKCYSMKIQFDVLEKDPEDYVHVDYLNTKLSSNFNITQFKNNINFF